MSKTTNKFSLEVRDRTVRLVLDSEGQHGSRWQSVMSISSKIGCAPQTPNEWVKKSDQVRRDEALRPELLRVFEENWRVCGVRKLWRGSLAVRVSTSSVARLRGW